MVRLYGQSPRMNLYNILLNIMLKGGGGELRLPLPLPNVKMTSPTRIFKNITGTHIANLWFTVNRRPQSILPHLHLYSRSQSQSVMYQYHNKKTPRNSPLLGISHLLHWAFPWAKSKVWGISYSLETGYKGPNALLQHHCYHYGKI